MIISCPACESRFKIDPDRVPAEGRQVRCGKCAHVWRIAADGGSIPAADGSPPEPAGAGDPAESADAGSRSGLFGRSTPATDDMPVGETVSPSPADESRDGDGPENPAEQVAATMSDNAAAAVQEGETDAGNDADPALPLLGSTITPNARQKLAEARKGRSRVRFLVIALALMIVVVVAVSFIKGADGPNDALRNVPGLDEGNAGGIVEDPPVSGSE